MSHTTSGPSPQVRGCQACHLPLAVLPSSRAGDRSERIQRRPVHTYRSRVRGQLLWVPSRRDSGYLSMDSRVHAISADALLLGWWMSRLGAVACPLHRGHGSKTSWSWALLLGPWQRLPFQWSFSCQVSEDSPCWQNRQLLGLALQGSGSWPSE